MTGTGVNKPSKVNFFLRSVLGHEFKWFPAKKKQASDWLIYLVYQ